MSDEVMPCAWCGKAPVTGFRNTSIRCMTLGPTQDDVCCMAIVPDMGVREWNLTQQRIIARRKADMQRAFEAARKRENKVNPNLYVMERQYVGYKYDSVDDYLKGRPNE